MFNREDNDVKALESTLRGSIILPGDATYDHERECWNLDVSPAPGVIIQVRGASDVVAALKFAQERSLDVSVAGGRHMARGLSMAGSVVIDMRLNRTVHVDPNAKVAWVDGGCIIEDIDKEALLHGLACVGGMYYDTGIGGFTLGGGYGYLSTLYGTSCDNLLGVEMVTADGTVRTVDADNDPDLFWALRGAGWAFGVVTRFKFKLHELKTVENPAAGPDAPPVHGLGGLIFWPVERLMDVVTLFVLLHANKEVPRETTPVIGLATTPNGPMVALQFVWLGELEAGHQWLRKFLNLGEPAMNTVAPLDYIGIQHVHDAMLPPGLRYYLTTRYSDDAKFFADAATDTVAPIARRIEARRSFEGLPAGVNAFLAMLAPGYAVEEQTEPVAFASRGSRVMLMAGVSAPPHEAVDFTAAIAYIKEFMEDTIGPFIVPRFYPNLTCEVGVGDAGNGPSAFSAPNLARLQAIKYRVDPDNVFRSAKLG